MNQQCHRIVFNRSRGAYMAVQETASSISGAGCGQTRRTRGAQPQQAGGEEGRQFVTRLRTLAWGVLCTLGLSTMVWAQTLPLTVRADAPSGQRPVIDAAANGVPVVHIAPPSAAGVSRNVYQQFNVDAKGLILNNSASNVQTQLGGWISGNPQLGYVPARLIVNEVMGTNASILKGTIEVAGRKADVVIANPNGLLCDGCGFINTGRATLTTGTPQYSENGGLTGFSVSQGQLNIGSGGLNASNLEQLDLIARGLVIEGEVWAQNLHVLA
ncbi:filamentous hemagglutinin, partial [Pelomonas sp. HMWF004]